MVNNLVSHSFDKDVPDDIELLSDALVSSEMVDKGNSERLARWLLDRFYMSRAMAYELRNERWEPNR